ncbi:MAG: M1 family metallopeptidase [Chloroflexi bacterium]|nr:M1 family metallopeptidase [Chloroflexota bacterium]
MPSITYRRTLIWAVAALLTAASIYGALFSTSDAEAHQPIGLRVSESEMPEPPCTYWDDDACEEAAAPRVSVNPFQSDNPHDPVLNANSGDRDHHAHLESIAALNQKVLARLSDSGDALNRQALTRPPDSGGASKEADGEPNGPGGDVSYAITSDITGLPWIRDGVTEAEAITGGWLGLLQDYNPSLVTSLVRMPFLQDHTPGDLQAIQTLTLMSAGTPLIDPNPQYARNLVNRAAFADGGGVDNTEAKIIAVTSMPYFQGQDTLIDLLADYGTVEETSVRGQHDNALTFAIVRLITSRQNSELMQSATSATRHSETVMAQALPTDFVGVLVSSNLIPDAAGANNSIHLWVDSGFDGDLYSDRYRQRTIAHEIGHYWWSTNNDHEAWISEGAAEYISAYSEKTQFGDNGLFTSYYPCPYYRTIEHLRAENPDYRFSLGSLCNYSLGERLFINLDRSIGHTAFATGFRNLHQRLSTYEDDEIDQGLSLMSAFCSSCLTSNASFSSAGYTLARRYGEMILTDTSDPTGTIAGLGSSPSVSLRDYGHNSRQYRIAEVSASSPDQRRWLRLYFSDATNPPETVRVGVQQYHEERYPYYSAWQERTVYQSESGPAAWFHVYLGDPFRRAPGHHWVYVYNESGQKIAEAEYQVVP